MTKHFRITAYNKEKDYSIIIESNGLFNEIEQFTSYLLEKNLQIISLGHIEEQSSNNDTTTICNDKMILRAIDTGFPIIKKQMFNGINKRIITVKNFTYIT